MHRTTSVAVLGGGIAGLTAAHELAGRGLDVTVYEARGGGVRGLGGKARSQYFKVDGVEVPGEHGFRFMPAFYWCVPETMSRIPASGSADPREFRRPCNNSVGDGLIGLKHMALARENFPLMSIYRNVPKLGELPGLVATLKLAFHNVSASDMRHVARRVVHYATRGPIERREVHERQSFAEFMDMGRMQPIARRLLEQMPQSLVAMKASEGSARTLMDVLLLMMLDFRRPGPSEWVLPGPTTDTWLAPWAQWLERLGVLFVQGPAHAITALEGDGGRILRAHRAEAGPIEADWFVLATPAEASRAILTASPTATASCAQLRRAACLPESAMRWMVGSQFLVKEDRPWVRGHVAFVDSAWGITGVSQRQFWRPEYVQQLQKAGGKGMLSVIATEWERPKHCEVPMARDMSREEIQHELIRQISKCRDAQQQPMLLSEDVVAFHCDQDLSFGPDRPTENRSPLLIHPPGIWSQRPQAASELDNLVLCGDYVQNPMDLATMEGANASARLAVNHLLDAMGHPDEDRVPLVANYQRLHEPASWRRLGRLNDLAFQRRRASSRRAG